MTIIMTATSHLATTRELKSLFIQGGGMLSKIMTCLSLMGYVHKPLENIDVNEKEISIPLHTLSEEKRGN